MKRSVSLKVIAALSLLCISFIAVEAPTVTVFLIGDSTISEKETKAYPETGWGMPFKYFFDSTVTVENHAKNGRSTRTFISENRWQPVIDKVKEGDYVFMQFGHNDESKEKVDRYTSPEDYKANLTRFITETKKKKGIPVLLTPVSRRYFDSTGHIKETHLEYSELARQVAKETQVTLIDLDKKSQALYQTMGPETSKLLFLWLEPNEHPNFPKGKQDNTHFNELGARKVAQLILDEIKIQKLDLATRIVKR
jgi:lysophospholipase L1-like esterase